MNWFERNLINSQQQEQINSVKYVAATVAVAAAVASSSNNQLVALKKDVHVTNAIEMPSNEMTAMSHGSIAKQSFGQPTTTSAMAAAAVAETNARAKSTTNRIVIAITNPPIVRDDTQTTTTTTTTTTQYAPAWKSLIAKIAQSNKNDLINVNRIANVGKAWSTVMAQLRATTNPTPIKATQSTPSPPIQQDNCKFSSNKQNTLDTIIDS